MKGTVEIMQGTVETRVETVVVDERSRGRYCGTCRDRSVSSAGLAGAARSRVEAPGGAVEALAGRGMEVPGA